MKGIATTILVTVAICNSQIGFTQSDFRSGYIITAAGDTLSGLVDYREGAKAHESCVYKKSENEKTIVYAPGEMLGYRFTDDKLFVSRTIEVSEGASKPAFVEVLVKGLVSLHKFESTYYLEKENRLYRLSNDRKEVILDGRTVYRYSNRHVAVMNILLSDCPEIRRRIESARLNEKTLAALVEDYNRCKGKSSITYKANRPWVTWIFGVTAGVNFSRIAFKDELVDEYLRGSYQPSISPVVGISLDIFSPRLSERISFHGDILYLSSKYDNTNVYQNGVATKRNYVTIELQQLKTPISFRYRFPTRKITPYFSLGLSNTFHVGSKSTWVQVLELPSGDETYKHEALKIDRNQLGCWGGLGILKSIHRKYNAFLEVRYEQTDGIGKNTVNQHFHAVSNVVNFQMNIGLRAK